MADAKVLVFLVKVTGTYIQTQASKVFDGMSRVSE